MSHRRLLAHGFFRFGGSFFGRRFGGAGGFGARWFGSGGLGGGCFRRRGFLARGLRGRRRGGRFGRRLGLFGGFGPGARAERELGDLDPGQLLAVAGAALVAALGLELEHAQLLAALVRDHLGGDLHLRQARLVEHGLLGAVQDRLQRHALALGGGQALDQQALAALDAVLLAACLHDRVHTDSAAAFRCWSL